MRAAVAKYKNVVFFSSSARTNSHSNPGTRGLMKEPWNRSGRVCSFCHTPTIVTCCLSLTIFILQNLQRLIMVPLSRKIALRSAILRHKIISISNKHLPLSIGSFYYSNIFFIVKKIYTYNLKIFFLMRVMFSRCCRSISVGLERSRMTFKTYCAMLLCGLDSRVLVAIPRSNFRYGRSPSASPLDGTRSPLFRRETAGTYAVRIAKKKEKKIKKCKV